MLDPPWWLYPEKGMPLYRAAYEVGLVRRGRLQTQSRDPCVFIPYFYVIVLSSRFIEARRFDVKKETNLLSGR